MPASMIKGVTQRTLRWPLLFAVVVILALELVAYALIRSFVLLYEWASNINRRHAAIKDRLLHATSFTDWCRAARELDQAEGREAWKKDPSSPYYDPELITSHLTSLRTHRASSNMRLLMKNLKTIYSLYNFAGINNYQLYNQTNFGTKVLIQDFIQEVLECTILVRDSHVVPLATRREWFRRVKKAYGRTALLLSGGAGMGYYHVGVLKALYEAKCMPNIVSGASAGSLMCAYLAVRKDDELADFFHPSTHALFRPCSEHWWVKARRWMTKGYLFDVNDWMIKLRRDITRGDITFAEAFAMTGRTVNITITSVSKYVPSIILNYKTTPDVLIWSAILASSAMPNIIQPVELLCKDNEGKIRPFHVHGKTWTDGTIKNDIPIKEIASMHNANFFIVSQVNPHLVPFFYSSRGSTGRPSQHSSGSGYRGGFILSMIERLLKLDMKKWLQLLSELDLLPSVFGSDFRFIFLQPVSGTVTIVPAAPVKAYFRMLSDPSYESMLEYIQIGERCTWTKLARISNHYRLERLLTDCKKVLDGLASKAEEDKRREVQREVREIVREARAKERWSSEEGEDEEKAPVEEKVDDESIVVERVGEMDTSNPLRRASLARESRELERSLKQKLIKEQLQQHKEALTSPTKSRPASADSAGRRRGGVGTSEPEHASHVQQAESSQTLDGAVDVAPPIVFGDQGEAYLTDNADTDDDFEDDGPPASPLKNLSVF